MIFSLHFVNMWPTARYGIHLDYEIGRACDISPASRKLLAMCRQFWLLPPLFMGCLFLWFLFGCDSTSPRGSWQLTFLDDASLRTSHHSWLVPTNLWMTKMDTRNQFGYHSFLPCVFFLWSFVWSFWCLFVRGVNLWQVPFKLGQPGLHSPLPNPRETVPTQSSQVWTDHSCLWWASLCGVLEDFWLPMSWSIFW